MNVCIKTYCLKITKVGKNWIFRLMLFTISKFTSVPSIDTPILAFLEENTKYRVSKECIRNYELTSKTCFLNTVMNNNNICTCKNNDYTNTVK